MQMKTLNDLKKLYMRAYMFKKKSNTDGSARTEGVTSLEKGVFSQEMYLSEF